VSIEEIATSNNFSTHIDAGFADYLDSVDELASFRDEFLLPPNPHGPDKTIYLCGNSLGLQPKRLRSVVVGQLDKWSEQGVEGHFLEPTPWVDIDATVSLSMSKLVGAKQSEVVVMNSLTVNLHLMMSAFYRPTATRNKILIEKKAFPSDYHAVVSQIQLHGFDPKEALIEVAPRDGEVTLHQEDIEAVIAANGDSIALVLFSGIQYYTGQLFDIEKISAVAHAHGCMVGIDLAHAVGNVPLQLHDWGVDFACWCSYKYMNCGPGSIGGCFVHERFGNGNAPSQEATAVSAPQSAEHLRFADVDPPQPLRLAGWWGHRYDDRFQMDPRFIPAQGVNGFRLSNPPVLLIACIRASLDLFDEVCLILHLNRL
jgi:kynureninase